MKSSFKRGVGEILLFTIMIMVSVVIAVKATGGDHITVYSAVDGSRCWVEVVEDGELVEYPCTGRFANARSDNSLEKITVAPQWMVDQSAGDPDDDDESKDLASRE